MHAAAAAGEVYCLFKCGPREIVKLIVDGQKIQKKRCEDKPWILAACRRNGYLHWRPNLDKGVLELAEDQEWAKELPEGSHRYPSRWLEERGSWLKGGKPLRSTLEDIEDDIDMQVFLKKGKVKLKDMLKTTTRKEAMQAMVPVAGKHKKVKKKKDAGAKKEEQEKCKKLKGK